MKEVDCEQIPTLEMERKLNKAYLEEEKNGRVNYVQL